MSAQREVKQQIAYRVLVFTFRIIALMLALVSISKRIERRAIKRTKALFSSEPSSKEDFAKVDVATLLTEQELKLDENRKSKMLPDELLWEHTLEENLGHYYLALYKRDKINGFRTSWDYVHENTTLPNVIIIGDSISRGYTIPVRDALKGVANVFRAPQNCGPTSNGLRKIDLYLGNNHKWDLIVYNFGIHDRMEKYDTYLNNLEDITTRLKQTGAAIVFVATTPFFPVFTELKEGDFASVPKLFKNWYEYGRGMNEDQINNAARTIMQKFGIPVIDCAQRLGDDLTQNRKSFDVHFPENFYSRIAEPIVNEIRKHLAPTSTVEK